MTVKVVEEEAYNLIDETDGSYHSGLDCKGILCEISEADIDH